MIPPRRAALEQALAIIAPRLPEFDRQAVLDHAQSSPGLAKGSPQAAAWLALVAHVRHLYSDYDQMLADGYDADEARYFCKADMITALQSFGVSSAMTDAFEA